MDKIETYPVTDIPDFHSRGYLPHLENKMLQVITIRLYDSVPQQVIDQWKNTFFHDENSPVQTHQNKDIQKKMHKLIDEYEDNGSGQCFLRDKRIAEIMESTLFHYEGRYYHLVRWVIMPNHVHVMIGLKPGVKLSTIVQKWKSYTAHAANTLLGRKGDFWMPEYYDRYIRDHKHMVKAIAYIDANPVKAGLAKSPAVYRWSSAYHEDKEKVSGNGNGNGSAGDPARNL